MPTPPLTPPDASIPTMCLYDAWVASGAKFPFFVWWKCPEGRSDSHPDWRYLEFVENENNNLARLDPRFYLNPSYYHVGCDDQHSGFAQEARYYPIINHNIKGKTCKCDYRQVYLVTGCRCGLPRV